MDPQQLIGRELKAVWIAPYEVHPAWREQTTPALASGFANLDLAEMQTVKVQPCEVEQDQGKYPSLGIELQIVSDPPMIHRWSEGGEVGASRCGESFLPSRVAAVRIWDALGEGPNSALALTLENGRMVVIRHIYPPMTLGIEFSGNEV
jgi:hypothetical protein